VPGIMDLIWPGAFVVQSIHVVARLGIADFLGPEPQTVDELAGTAQVHAPSLKRVLRALTTLGVFAEDIDGRFRQTDLSRTLREDHPESVRAWALMLGAPFVWRPVGDLYESVRTGTPGFRRPVWRAVLRVGQDASRGWSRLQCRDDLRVGAAVAGVRARSWPASFAPARRREACSSIYPTSPPARRHYVSHTWPSAARSWEVIFSSRYPRAGTRTFSAA